jgi:hypothetical protein
MSLEVMVCGKWQVSEWYRYPVFRRSQEDRETQFCVFSAVVEYRNAKFPCSYSRQQNVIHNYIVLKLKTRPN